MCSAGELELSDLDCAAPAPPPPPRRRSFLPRRRPLHASRKVIVAGDWSIGTAQLIHSFFSVKHNLRLCWVPAQGLGYDAMTRIYYEDAVGALIVFDFTRRSSLEVAGRWKRDIDEKVFGPALQPIPCVLLGNKADLQNADRWETTDEEIDAFLIEHQFIDFLKTTRLSGANLELAVRKLALRIRQSSLEQERVFRRRKEMCLLL
jgi:GTPase SAR1 family protein